MSVVIGANLTQTLFDQNMKTLKPGHSTAMKFANLKMGAAGVNDIESQDDEMKKLTPAFVEQANLSTWYQSNPWQILTDSSKYDVAPLGGPVDFEQPPGYRPGNTLMTQKPKQAVMNPIRENFKENFANATEEPQGAVGLDPVSIGIIIVLVLVIVLVALSLFAGQFGFV